MFEAGRVEGRANGNGKERDSGAAAPQRRKRIRKCAAGNGDVWGLALNARGNRLSKWEWW